MVIYTQSFYHLIRPNKEGWLKRDIIAKNKNHYVFKKYCTTPCASQVLVASAMLMKTIVSPTWNFRIDFVDPSNMTGTLATEVKELATPKVRTFFSGEYSEAPSEMARVEAVVP